VRLRLLVSVSDGLAAPKRCLMRASVPALALSCISSAGAGASGSASRASQLLLLVPGAVAAGLGAWQLQRREWKVEQLAERTRQLAADPLPMEALSAPGAPPLGEWRRVACKGELRHEAASYVRARCDTQRHPGACS
jgi:surfeit locus 1 family protein